MSMSVSRTSSAEERPLEAEGVGGCKRDGDALLAFAEAGDAVDEAGEGCCGVGDRIAAVAALLPTVEAVAG